MMTVSASVGAAALGRDAFEDGRQLGGIVGDRRRVDIRVGLVEVGVRRHAGQHQHAARTDRVGRPDVRVQSVADDHGSLDGHAGRLGGRAEERRAGLADDEVRLPIGSDREGGHDRAGTGLELIRAGIDMIAIGGHETRPAANRLGGEAEALVAQGEVDAHDDRVGSDLEPEARRGDRLDAHVPQLAGEALSAEDHDAAGGRRAVGESEGGSAGGGDDHRRIGGRAHRAQAFHVVAPVPARVVGGVDDLVAGSPASGQQLGHAGHGDRAAIDDAVEIDDEQHPRMVEA